MMDTSNGILRKQNQILYRNSITHLFPRGRQYNAYLRISKNEVEQKDSLLGINPILERETTFFDSTLTSIQSKSKKNSSIIFNLTFELSNEAYKNERALRNLNEGFSWIGGLLAILTPLINLLIGPLIKDSIITLMSYQSSEWQNYGLDSYQFKIQKALSNIPCLSYFANKYNCK